MAFLYSNWLFFLWHSVNEFTKFIFNVSHEMTNGGGQLKISGYSSSSSSWLGTALYDDSGSPLCSCCPDHWKPRNKNTIKARKAANNLYDARIPMAPINNPPSIVPPPVPTPTNRPFRIPVRKKWGKVTVIFDKKNGVIWPFVLIFVLIFWKPWFQFRLPQGDYPPTNLLPGGATRDVVKWMIVQELY